MTLRSNITHSKVALSEPVSPAEVEVKFTIEDASGLMFLHQTIFTVADPDGGEDLVQCESGGGLGSDLIVFQYRHSDGTKRRMGFHLTHAAAALIERIDPKAPADLLAFLRR